MGGLTKGCNSPTLIHQHKRIQHDFVLPMHFFDYLQLLLFYDNRNASTYFMTVYTCRGSSTQGRSAASVRSPFWRFVHSYLFWPITPYCNCTLFWPWSTSWSGWIIHDFIQWFHIEIKEHKEQVHLPLETHSEELGGVWIGLLTVSTKPVHILRLVFQHKGNQHVFYFDLHAGYKNNFVTFYLIVLLWLEKGMYKMKLMTLYTIYRKS